MPSFRVRLGCTVTVLNLVIKLKLGLGIEVLLLLFACASMSKVIFILNIYGNLLKSVVQLILLGLVELQLANIT